MTSREAMIYQLKQLKGKPLKQKLVHIFTYFWIPIVAVLAVLVFAVSMIVNTVNQKDPALTVCFLNSLVSQESAQDYLDGFAQTQGIDLEEYEVTPITGLLISEEDAMSAYQNLEMIMAMMAAQSLDLMAGDRDAILRYAYQESFWDLSQILTPEQLEKYSDSLFYMDMAFVRQLEETDLTEEALEYPDPTQPETMEEPVPVAIWVPEASEFTQMAYQLSPGALGIVCNTVNLENALAFLDYVLE